MARTTTKTVRRRKAQSRLTRELLETSRDMLASGLMTQGAPRAVFAPYLNLTVGYVSQLERGAKRPSGPALVLLDVIRRKGIGAIL